MTDTIKKGNESDDTTKSGKDTSDNKMKNEVPKRRWDIDQNKYNFNQLLSEFFMNDPFLGYILSSIPRREDWTVPTAYVGLHKEGRCIQMGYNPEFMRSLRNDSERQYVFKHELYHAILKHVTTRRITDPKNHPLWNISTDLCINSGILTEKNAPEIVLLAGKRPKNCKDEELAKLIESFPTNQSSDWYYTQLKDYAEQKESNGSENGVADICINIGADGEGATLDGHGGWNEIPEEVRELLDEKMRAILQNGYRFAKSNGWGSVPQEIKELIEKMFSGEVDWRNVLRNFMATCRTVERESTVKRISKKAPYLFPGMKRIHKARLAFFIDQSGSMDNESVQRAFAAAFDCSKEVEFDCYNFDTEVDEASHEVWKRGKSPEWKRTRSGGTDFNAVAEFVNNPKNRGKWTGVVICTDGYAPGMGPVFGAKILWLITPEGTMECLRKGDLVIRMGSDKQAKRF